MCGLFSNANIRYNTQTYFPVNVYINIIRNRLLVYLVTSKTSKRKPAIIFIII